MSNYSPYIEHIKKKIPQVFSLIDREPSSITHGCGDRLFWCWKFTDFPGSRFQEYLYTLGWLYSHNTNNNPWKNNEHILLLIEAGLNYWNYIQHKDGSFDEAYPFEHSLAATAFTLFYANETYKIVKDSISEHTKKTFYRTSFKAANWLCKNDEEHGMLSNHIAAASAACLNSGEIHNNTRFKERHLFFLKKIMNHQSVEGWYEEYGGPDIGYQTHCTFYLAHIWRTTKNKGLLSSIQRANKFIAHFMHPDGSLGGEYASRNTMFYFPAGYEILNSVCDNAAAINLHMREMVENDKTVGLMHMDSHNLYPMLNNYLFAHTSLLYNENNSSTARSIFWKNIGSKYFEVSGLYVKSTDSYYAVLGGKKGGVLRVWNKKTKKIAFQSCGYITKIGNKHYSSQSLGLSNMTIKGNTTEISAPFVAMNQKVFTTLLFIGFRSFSISLGRIPSIAYWLKKLLVRVLVNKKKRIKISMIRKVEFMDDKIILKDYIENNIYNIWHCDKFNSFHMGSSRYAHLDEELSRGLGYKDARLNFDKFGVITKATICIK